MSSEDTSEERPKEEESKKGEVGGESIERLEMKDNRRKERKRLRREQKRRREKKGARQVALGLKRKMR